MPEVRRRRGERGVWHRRFRDHAIRGAADHAAHLDYAHFNPVKLGHVPQPSAWPYSTFRACVERGLYSPDWLGAGTEHLPAHRWTFEPP